ncbi:MAG: LysM peptidoglycan-binding domain-containing protein, partial [Chryseolinea sp.]
FYLNGTSGSYKEFAKTYILKKQVDWATLSKLTGISVNDLKNLNGITEDKLKIFQPVRLPARLKSVPTDIFFGTY